MKQLLIALSMALASSVGVAAETWPAKPVRIIVPFPPGSSPDLIARMLADKLAQALGQPVIVDHKPGVNTVKEFIDYVKARPGKLNYGSVGNGSASHLTMELLKMRSGMDIVHVPYPGSPQVN